MTPEGLNAFAEEWIAAWNAHDLERILGHYSDAIVFESPGVVVATGDARGRVEGKAALEAYWRRALALQPDLRFELRAVHAGPLGCALRYWSVAAGREVIEVMEFDGDGRICRGAAFRQAETN